MRYVMVPVPSEFVMDVLRLVVFQAPDPDDVGGMRDQGRLRRILETADETTRALVLLVARATLDDDRVRYSDAAEELGMDGDALRVILRELNTTALGGDRELIMISDEVAVRVHGNRGRNRYLVMRTEHARTVRTLTQTAEAPPA